MKFRGIVQVRPRALIRGVKAMGREGSSSLRIHSCPKVERWLEA
jgi:hypothetical protein